MRQERYIKESLFLLQRLNDELETRHNAFDNKWMLDYLKELDYTIREGKALL